MTRKKAPKYQDAPPKVSDLNEAKVLIDELWEQLRHYEDKLTTSSKSKNSSKSPSSDSPKARHERKKLKALVVAIREDLNKATQGINESSPH